ncbi:MAG TPA: hypothetical protein VF899_00435 [Pyrinomonadaceae bacterium]
MAKSLFLLLMVTLLGISSVAAAVAPTTDLPASPAAEQALAADSP